MTLKLVHLSDLHFGTERPGVLEALLPALKQIEPDLIVVSGDLTQRALHSQYQHAKEFLNNLGNRAILCVPGNHDISWYNLMERYFYPLRKYKKYIDHNLFPSFFKENLAVLGINSATPFKTMGGYVTEDQLRHVKEFFSHHSDKKIRMVVMHHNLIRSERHKIINDAEKIISSFASSNVNLVLSGHIHAPHIELLKKNYLFHNMYIITAGTAISHRTILPNSFNVLEIHENRFKLSVRSFNNDEFVSASEDFFEI